MRSSGVPARAASTMQRTAARTSSSQSETVMIRVRSAVDDVQGLVRRRDGVPPRCRRHVDAADRPLDLGVGPGVAGGPRQDHDVACRRPTALSSAPPWRDSRSGR